MGMKMMGMDMKALAAAAVAKKNKRAAQISEGAKKTEEKQVQKTVALRDVKEEGLDEETQTRIASEFTSFETKRATNSCGLIIIKPVSRRHKDSAAYSWRVQYFKV